MFKATMKKHLRIFLAGVLVLAPFAFTAYVVYAVGYALDTMVSSRLPLTVKQYYIPGTGLVAILILVYLVGLLTHWYGFRMGLDLAERVLLRVPVLKTLYESVRDILKLFGGDAKKMGQVIRWKIPGTDAYVLGIRTSTTPKPAKGENRVAVYVPMSYQLGGFTVYVSPDAIEPLDMTVEEALKIAATASAGAEPTPPQNLPTAAQQPPDRPV